MLKKEINLGQAIAIVLTASMAIFTWVMSISTRLEGSEVRIENNMEDIESMEASMIKFGDKVDGIDDKIDENFKIIIDKLDEKNDK
tara:strand:- start:43 stop:300 length:258 start_codon:yes stop_codon:yes gene_type:complete